MWGDSGRRQDIPLFKDAENAQELPQPITSLSDLLDFEELAVLGRRIGLYGEYSFIK